MAECFKSAANSDGKPYYEEMQRIKNNLPHTCSCDEVKSDYEDLVGTRMMYTDDYGICKAANDFGGGSYAGNLITVPQYHLFLGKLIGGENEINSRKFKAKQRAQNAAVIALVVALLVTIGAILLVNVNISKYYRASAEMIDEPYILNGYEAWISEAEYVKNEGRYGTLYFTVKSYGKNGEKGMHDYNYSVYYSPGGKLNPDSTENVSLPWMGFVNIPEANAANDISVDAEGCSSMKCKYVLRSNDDLLSRYIRAYGLGRMKLHLTFTPILSENETENPVMPEN